MQMQSFDTLGLRPELVQAVEELGFKEPTPVQAKAIPQLLSSKQDLIAYAQTGTGKTAAFSLPVINQIDSNSRSIQALVLCPTRELCIQTSNEIRKFLQHLPQIHIVSVYGGDPKERQLREIRRGAHIIVGTPGRVHDFIRTKKLKFSETQWLILDEADEMLSMGFKDDLDAILDTTPTDKQTLLFSATMPKGIKNIIKTYMDKPVEINAGTQNISAENINHVYCMVRARDKFPALKRLLDNNPDIYGIVFCRTRRDTKEIADKLIQNDYSADALHGDLSQSQREHVMKRFRAKQLQILVATDVAARGLDINNLTHVVNYHLPDQMEAYIHRSGRTGRAGRSGESISLINSREKNKIRDLQRIVGKEINAKEIPTGTEICERRLLHFIDRIEQAEIDVEDSPVEAYLSGINSKLADISKEELVKRLVTLEFNRFLSYYKNAPDLNIRSVKRDEQGNTSRRSSFSRFFINLGHKDDVDPKRIIKLLNEQMNDHSFEIGKIEILRNFSFFEIDSRYKDEVLQAFKEANFNGRRILVESSKERKAPDNSRGDRGGDGGERRKKRRSFGKGNYSGGRRERKRKNF